ncbi:RsmB/NOP family class I SAM-dependent RNA methyltransferase [Solidesulfovibrio carbinolicus]|uniref:tRNA/rRNA cytosine-C5-methylase n=1 Tax=Solidesulfovibrio carbinolicus TaxID=296842 RepID=A0A4P6HQ53_9BACT|nr:RsmB/NOP family class I SAM-dependent RNA methyltransferase [Solidesulfovibrio carbinolicus]QAZ68906.1 tRNA/rRNA cytosine-C5-methylase [Solidesulfovibrio carbinolicus]
MAVCDTDGAKGSGRSFRLVCQAGQRDIVEAFLAATGHMAEAEPFSPWCRRVVAEPTALGASLAARFGYIHIQDRSSMLPPLLLDPPAGARVLDMCAAPGGKTGFLAQLVGPTGFVLGNEPSPDRLATLRQTLFRESLANTATCSFADLSPQLPAGSFTHILLDPPCSGWGTLDKNPQAAKIWAGDKVAPLVGLQRKLLATAAALLAPGGRVLYSTCTTNVAENEDQTRFALDELPLRQIPLAAPAGFVFEAPHRGDVSGVLRVDSAASAAQGFYMALFEKIGGEADDSGDGTLPGESVPQAAITAAGCDPSGLPPGAVRSFGDKAFFLHAGAARLPAGFRYQGFAVGSFRSKVFRPHGRARLLMGRGGPGLNELALSRIEALLAGQSLPAGDLPARAGLYWRGLPLGFLTRKGSRALWSDR